MPDTTYEDRVARYEGIKHDHDAGVSLRAIGLAHGISAERVRQILKTGAPNPNGLRRAGDGMDPPTTRKRHRLERRIVHWSQFDSDVARAMVAKFTAELEAFEREKEWQMAAKPPVEIVNEGGPALWQYSAFGTHYRGLLVETGPEGPRLFGEGGDVLVAVQPAGGKRSLPTARMWHVFPIARLSVLHQSYVEEKFACEGEDAVAITILVATMLGREPAFRDGAEMP